MYRSTDPRQQAISLLLDIEENNTIMLGRKRFARHCTTSADYPVLGGNR